MNIGTIIMILFYVLLIVLLVYPKSKNYLRQHKELATAILYTYLVVWFARLLLTRKTIQAILIQMKTNGLYLFLLLLYVCIPAFFLYKAIQNYIAYYVKKNDQPKEAKIEVKNEPKKKGKKK